MRWLSNRPKSAVKTALRQCSAVGADSEAPLSASQWSSSVSVGYSTMSLMTRSAKALSSE